VQTRRLPDDGGHERRHRSPDLPRQARKREPLLELLRTRAFPLQRELGMKILGPFPHQDDDVSFVWLRGFPDQASREPLKAAFYEGEQ
jgi:hypothetical protein